MSETFAPLRAVGPLSLSHDGADDAPRMSPRGPVIVATDGGPSAAHAARAASLVAAAWHVPVEVLMVGTLEEPRVGGVALGLEPPILRADRDGDRRQQDVKRTAGRELADIEWRLVRREGSAAAEIAREASLRHASLVVLGHGAPTAIAAIVHGGNVALRAIRRVTCPVLVVHEWWSELPTHVVVGVDFSVSSVWAAELAARFVKPGGRLDVVHVAPLDAHREAGRHREREYEDWAGERLEHVRALLQRATHAEIRTFTSEGEVAAQLRLCLGTPREALLVVGDSGLGRLERLIVGSVTTAIVRDAGVSVLAVPTPPMREAERLAEALGLTVEHLPPEEWTSALDAFSRRNAGRAAWLDTVDPERGGFAQERGFAFHGVTYDAVDDRIHLMLGGSRNPQRHVTRTIDAARSVTIHVGQDGQEQYLSIWRGEGVTQLRLGEPTA
jgi:nucleotide-binding universal stress UspA family protein